MYKIAAIVTFLVLSLVSTAASAGDTGVSTGAGTVVLRRNDSTETCSVMWNGKALFAWACPAENDPDLVTHAARPTGGYSEILVVQELPMGNACHGTSFLLFGVDSTVQFIGEIPYCGGPDPVISATADTFKLTIPDHSPNRGSGVLRGEVWVVEKQRLRRLK